MKLTFSKVSKNLIEIKPDKRTEVFNWGSDNAFPSLISGLVSISPTAKSCVDKVSKAICGGGFGSSGKMVVNSSGETLNKVFGGSSYEYGENNNIFLQVGYDLNFNFSSLKLVPNSHCRLGKADDKDYSGKWVVYDNWDKTKNSRIMSDGFKLVDVFNPDEKVVAGQMLKAEKEGRKYYGQIIQVKKGCRYKYGISDLETVMEECLLERNSRVFRGRGAEKGFLNTKLVTTKPFTDDEDRRDFQRDLDSATGAENSSSAIHLESMNISDNLDDVLRVDDLSSEYNDKLFEYSDREAERNICKTMGVPLILVNPSSEGIFGNSGELLKEAKRQMWESLEDERNDIEEIFALVMGNFAKPIQGLKIINPFEKSILTETTNDD